MKVPDSKGRDLWRVQGGTLLLISAPGEAGGGDQTRGCAPRTPPKGVTPLGIPDLQAGTGSAGWTSRPISIAIAAATRQRKPAATKAEA